MTQSKNKQINAGLACSCGALACNCFEAMQRQLQAISNMDVGFWRKIYAGLALSGLLSNSVIEGPRSTLPAFAVQQADALLEELQKPMA